MRIIKTKVYYFDELPENEKRKAITRLYDLNINHDWWEQVYEDAENIGLKLTGFDIGRGNSCEGNFTIDASEVCANIFRDHGVQCETYKAAESFVKIWQPVFDEYMEKEGIELEDKLMEMETDFLKLVLGDYLIMLRNEYEYQTSEAAIIESIIANEYEFTMEGELSWNQICSLD